MGILLNKLKSYNPTNLKKTESKKETLSAATKQYNNRQNVVEAFVRGTFLYKDGGYQIEEESEEKSEEELEKKRIKKYIKYIENESKGYDLFKNYFNFAVTSVLAKQLYVTKNKNKNNKLVNVIKSRLKR